MVYLRKIIYLLCVLAIFAEALREVPEGKKRKPKFLQDNANYLQQLLKQRELRRVAASKQGTATKAGVGKNAGSMPTFEVKNPSPQGTGSEVEIDIIKKIPAEKCPRKAQKGDLLQVYYIAYLPNGQQVDSSFKKGKPTEFVLGEGKALPAWELGLEGMCIGEIRELKTPVDLSSIGAGSGDNSLSYKIELAQILNYRWPEEFIKRDEL